MSKKGKERFKDKKAAVLNEENKKNKKGLMIGLGFVIAVLVFSGITLFGDEEKSFQTVVPENGAVRIPVSEVSDGKAHHYSHNDIKFFVLKSSDGVIRSAFDACDVCFPAKKGYRQEGDYMVCNNCGQRFASVNINVLKGGCNPAPLERKLEGGTLVLKVSDIESGRKYF